MRDDQQAFSALVRKIQQKIDNPGPSFRIEITGRFIGKNNVRIVDQRACDCDALLFTAGKFGRQMLHSVSQTHCNQTFFGAFSC